MIATMFINSTCGIMSIEDGSANPWRKHVWPLVHDHKVVYHALASMVCFQNSRNAPQLQAHGVGHHRQCMSILIDSFHKLPAVSAIAASLALAFAESWNTEFVTTTGVDHIHGAKESIQRAFNTQLHHRQTSDD